MLPPTLKHLAFIQTTSDLALAQQKINMTPSVFDLEQSLELEQRLKVLGIDINGPVRRNLTTQHLFSKASRQVKYLTLYPERI